MKETKLRTYIYSFFELQRSYKNAIAIFVDIIAVFLSIVMMFVLREHSLVILQDKDVFLSIRYRPFCPLYRYPISIYLQSSFALHQPMKLILN